jgi:threonine dehydrogenase-like Zn-dependent dehydrogenase
MKRAVTIGPRRVEIQEGSLPEAGPADAIVGVETVGLCAADAHFFIGDSVIAHYPHVQGHEFGGTILALPDGAARGLAVGDRVAVEPLLPCGRCVACRRGRTNACEGLQVIGAHVPGGLAEQVAVPAGNLHPVGDLPPALAAFVEPMSIAVHAVNRTDLQTGDHALVLGAGPIGQSIILAARDRGASVAVVDRIGHRLEMARALGADRTILAGPDVETAVLTWTGGDRPTVVFEATGVAAVVRQAIELVAHSGTVVAIGISPDDVPVPALTVTQKELSILGSRNSVNEFPDAIRIVTANRDLVTGLITHAFPFAQTSQAMAMAADQQDRTGKVQVNVSER